MPACTIYDYVEEDGHNDVQAFIDSLQSSERARLIARIDVLQENGFDILGTNMLTDTAVPQIKELRVNGRVAVRLLLCRGPGDPETEATLLYGAFERDNRYVPQNALDIADRRRVEVGRHPGRRVERQT